ncbi:hypothetical protein DFH11DRAFT_1730725 [Phellopilus nigrolimitatus]|nr:hypothetical protein DFH11DRAFT_1730725 [Phellopilus nigrolimitatus]
MTRGNTHPFADFHLDLHDTNVTQYTPFFTLRTGVSSSLPLLVLPFLLVMVMIVIVNGLENENANENQKTSESENADDACSYDANDEFDLMSPSLEKKIANGSESKIG